MTQDYSTEADIAADAIEAVFENKQVNKKNDISGDFSSDNASYPTVKAVKNLVGTKVASWSSTVSDTNYPTEKLVKDTLDTKAVKTNGVSEITDTNANAYTNIGNLSSGATQQSINSAVNSVIGDLKSIHAIEIVSSKPTASASTMHRLYIVSENSKVNVYYTVEDDGNYSWEKMDADILDELVINWSDIQGKPTFISQTDIDNSIADFANAFAERINPSS